MSYLIQFSSIDLDRFLLILQSYFICLRSFTGFDRVLPSFFLGLAVKLLVLGLERVRTGQKGEVAAGGAARRRWRRRRRRRRPEGVGAGVGSLSRPPTGPPCTRAPLLPLTLTRT